ncbi:EF-hand domain-containing protein [uncultured Paracoccus sp.]|uniref:EF-hand domain-containing protein n=1 Tax=uncultured Paracoccus sp. TaxID=189685 RepID=UPI0026281BD6|nr:EF-hand domain-containing protein [uncultured Paracoccus sp.]
MGRARVLGCAGAVLGAVLLGPAGALAQTGVPGEHFILNWDLNGDGAVDAAEMEEKRAELHGIFDSSGDGYLDAAEYAEFDAARAADMGSLPEAAAGRMRAVEAGLGLAANDPDGDGRVSRDEFVAGVPDWLAQVDRTGDGQVTTADFAGP